MEGHMNTKFVIGSVSAQQCGLNVRSNNLKILVGVVLCV
jgi:hypothetical protein